MEEVSLKLLLQSLFTLYPSNASPHCQEKSTTECPFAWKCLPQNWPFGILSGSPRGEFGYLSCGSHHPEAIQVIVCTLHMSFGHVTMSYVRLFEEGQVRLIKAGQVRLFEEGQ